MDKQDPDIMGQEKLGTGRVADVGLLRVVLHFLYNCPALRDLRDRIAHFDQRYFGLVVRLEWGCSSIVRLQDPILT